ncbi:hypothetical protein RDI58_017499 [Solanum bulbocastanum]|uniref:Uncharacterized protein n=1 Tax=Solanum bulbocastanum TaxID=147425 RepID=A0AAN8Y8W8_SOLBU
MSLFFHPWLCRKEDEFHEKQVPKKGHDGKKKAHPVKLQELIKDKEEVDESGQLLYFLEPGFLDDNRVDSQIWVAGEDGKFSVKSCSSLMQSQIGHWDLHWHWKMSWTSLEPLKVACFGWIAT